MCLPAHPLCLLLLPSVHRLQGALLLVLFQTSHVVEHLLTDRAQGNLAALYDAMPKEAVLVGMGPDGRPDLASARRVLAADVAVGDCMLVKPGEQVRRLEWWAGRGRDACTPCTDASCEFVSGWWAAASAP